MSDDKKKMTAPDQSLFESDEFPNNYTVEAEVGRGGMGVVYRATDKILMRPVAIKVLQQIQDTEIGRKRFLRELKVLSSLDHPNIPNLFSGGFNKSGQPLLVMEWIEGQTLSSFLKTGASFEKERLKRIFSQVLSATGYAHQQGIIHRDITAANIVLVAEENGICVKLLDFGLARSFLDESADNIKLTSTGMVLGNPAYMSPEQCRGSELGPATDIYAIACVLFECLAGTTLFQAESPLEQMYKHLNETPDLSSLRVSAALKAILSKCFAKRPEDRYASASELSMALTECFDSLDPQFNDLTGKSSSKMLIAGIVVVLAALLTLVVFVWSQHLQPGPRQDPSEMEEHLDPVQLADKGQSKYESAKANLDAGRINLYWSELKESIKFNQYAVTLSAKQLESGKITSASKERLLSCRYRGNVQLATCYQMGKDYDAAKKSYEAAIRCNPERSFQAKARPFRLAASMLKMVSRTAESRECLASLLSAKPEDGSPQDYKTYAAEACELSESLADAGELDESTKYAELCLKIFKDNHLENQSYVAMAYALLADNYKTQGNEQKMLSAIESASKMLVNYQLSEDQDTAALSTALLAKVLFARDRKTSEALFQKSILAYAPDLRLYWTYSRILDIYGELENQSHGYQNVEDFAQKILRSKEKLCANGMVRATCYKILAQARFMQGMSTDSRILTDNQCSEYIKLAVAESQENKDESKYIALEIGFIKARLRARQSASKSGAAKVQERDNALSQFKNCAYTLLTNYDYWQRQSIQDGAAEYLRLLDDVHDSERAAVLRSLMKGENKRSLPYKAKFWK